MNLIQTLPQVTVNDNFIHSYRIDATPIHDHVTHPLINSDPKTLGTRYTADFFSKIGLDIVTETIFKYPYPCVTEKTLRPINCKRMFVIVGAPHTLKLLHSKGFVSFDNIIDESYDIINNAEERFLSIVSAVEKFCTLSIEEIKNYYRENQWRLDHNWRTLKNLKQLEIEQFKKGLANV